MIHPCSKCIFWQSKKCIAETPCEPGKETPIIEDEENTGYE